jgi:hypothetical protein
VYHCDSARVDSPPQNAERMRDESLQSRFLPNAEAVTTQTESEAMGKEKREREKRREGSRELERSERKSREERKRREERGSLIERKRRRGICRQARSPFSALLSGNSYVCERR